MSDETKVTERAPSINLPTMPDLRWHAEYRRGFAQCLTQVQELNASHHPAVGGKYDDTLIPFLALMRRELHANSGKGDRPGWLAMSRETAMLEIWHHAAKLQKAALNDDAPAIREHAADVANMSMMLLDVCGALTNKEGA